MLNFGQSKLKFFPYQLQRGRLHIYNMRLLLKIELAVSFLFSFFPAHPYPDGFFVTVSLAGGQNSKLDFSTLSKILTLGRPRAEYEL